MSQALALTDIDGARALVSTEFVALGQELVVTQRIIDLFAESTGDKNPIHIDESLAASRKTIAHGHWVSAIAAGSIDAIDPHALFDGAKCWIAKTEAQFFRPVPVGRTVRCEGRIAEVWPEGNAVMMKLEWRVIVGSGSLAASGVYTIAYSRQKGARSSA